MALSFTQFQRRTRLYSRMLSTTLAAAAPIDHDSLTRGARAEITKGWIRVPISILLSGFLFYYVGAAVAWTWLAAMLTMEAGAAWARAAVVRGDVAARPLHVALTFAISIAWVVHAMLLWQVPSEIPRITTLMDLFTVAVYGAIGAHNNLRILCAVLAPPLLAICYALFSVLWTDAPFVVAAFASLATIGACATIAANGLTMHFADAALHRAHAALRTERDNLDAKVSERTHELAAATQRAEVASLAKSQFMALVSHEMRTPLNAIIGYTELALEDVNAQQLPNPGDLETVRQSSARLLRAINNVLDLANLEAGRLHTELEPTVIADVIEAAAAAVAPLAKENGNAVTLRIADGIAPVRTDARRLLQCVINVAENACKFTKSGEIVLSAHIEPKPHGPRLVIAVSDTGPGLTPAEIDRAFQPFGQEIETRKHEGMGLGLAIARKLLDLLEGDIALSGEAGSGLTVTMSIPRDG